MRKVSFGLIGCGRISTQHLDSIKLYGARSEITAVCDIIPEKAISTALTYDIPYWYSDYRKLLDRDDIQVVAICTPNGLHKRMAIDAAYAGKHALVEKPLATSVADIDRMIDTFKKRRKKLFVVLQVRHNPPLVYMRKFLTKKGLGKIRYAALTIRWYRPPAYFLDTWRGSKKLDGGALLNQGIHYLDAMQWLLGPVESIEAARTLNLFHRIEIEDTAFAFLKFTSGTWGVVELTLCNFPRNTECSLTIIGEKGNIKIGGQALNELEFWNVPGARKPRLAESIPPNVYAEGQYQGSCPYHFLVYRDVLDTLQKGERNPIGGREARRSIQIVEAIYKSAKIEREVRVNA